MADINKSLTFKKAEITLENGEYRITEYNKDDIKEYLLSDILDSWVGVDNITLTLKQIDELKPIEN